MQKQNCVTCFSQFNFQRNIATRICQQNHVVCKQCAQTLYLTNSKCPHCLGPLISRSNQNPLIVNQGNQNHPQVYYNPNPKQLYFNNNNRIINQGYQRQQQQNYIINQSFQNNQYNPQKYPYKNQYNPQQHPYRNNEFHQNQYNPQQNPYRNNEFHQNQQYPYRNDQQIHVVQPAASSPKKPFNNIKILVFLLIIFVCGFSLSLYFVIAMNTCSFYHRIECYQLCCQDYCENCQSIYFLKNIFLAYFLQFLTLLCGIISIVSIVKIILLVRKKSRNKMNNYVRA